MFNQEHGNRQFFFQVWCISASRTWCRLACSSRKSNMYSMARSRAEPQWCWRWFGRRHPWSSVACPWWPEAALGTFRRLSCYLSHHSAVLGSHGSWTRALLLFISKSALPMFSSGSSMVSGLFMSLTHFCMWYWVSEWFKVTQSYRTLCNPIDYTVHGILQARILEWETDLPNPGIEPRSPTLQADSLPAELSFFYL